MKFFNSFVLLIANRGSGEVLKTIQMYILGPSHQSWEKHDIFGIFLSGFSNFTGLFHGGWRQKRQYIKYQKNCLYLGLAKSLWNKRSKPFKFIANVWVKINCQIYASLLSKQNISNLRQRQSQKNLEWPSLYIFRHSTVG